MSSDKVPVTIKKYANRRLYNTASSAYVTLEDLAGMVKRGSDFVVTDAKSGDDITRSVLAQIIFEQEGKHGQSLLPITFLRQLIRFYGTGMQMLVPPFLELSLSNFVKEGGGKDGGPFGQTLPHNPLSSAARPMLNQLEEQARRNMAMFQQAMAMFSPFPAAGSADAEQAAPAQGADCPAEASPPAPRPPEQSRAEQSHAEAVEDMRRQLDEMQRRLETLAGKGE